MWYKSKAMSYYSGQMGEEYDPQGSHCVLVCYQYQQGVEREGVQGKTDNTWIKEKDFEQGLDIKQIVSFCLLNFLVVFELSFQVK